ncbi:MAG TPA: response regulator transcription factor [Caldilineaceae bacterium]|nr:response regulator transcription factor [Caldilineaceae bacterium]
MSEIRVLLVDDHPIIRSGIKMLLEQAPDIVVVGETDRGDDVVGLVNRLHPDVLLLDMEMPGKSGVDVARELQSAGSAVRILVLSAYDDDEYISSLISNGAAGYLTKEEALGTIVEAVRGVARGEEGWFSRRAAAQIAAMARKETTSGGQELTDREEEVLRMLAKGWTNTRIAHELSVSERTVRFHLSNIYDKLGVGSRAEAIAWALRRER